MSDPTKTIGSISLPGDFHFGQIDSMPTDRLQEGLKSALAPAEAPPAPPPPLGPLGALSDSWIGNGLNTIFRPENSKTATPLPVTPPATDPADNVLKSNLTLESLVFSPALGTVPNRGTNSQGDIQLNGMPYLQTIKDVTTGIRIHAEPGLWMIVQPTTVLPIATNTLARMASIPRGTTINAQGTSKTNAGGPNINAVDITPFPIGASQAATPIKFRSQTVTFTNTFRLPQDLGPFIAARTITQDILNNPNVVIRNIADKLSITSHVEIEISTKPGTPIFGGPAIPATPSFGGGADNIAFLLGDAGATTPNADAVEIQATFWIETVETTIVVPPCSPGDAPVLISPEKIVSGQPVPAFLVNPPIAITVPKTIKLTYTQIQDSQLVLLNFNGLSWPHISVATLVPAKPIPVPAIALSFGAAGGATGCWEFEVLR
jgi:hypothetical protein